MIRSLHIENYALIEQLDITFEQGFSVITGETGAGKSIMLGALALLLGQRADSKAIRQGAKKCVIEAHFEFPQQLFSDFFSHYELEYDDDCIFRREVNTSGKSRAFINDTPVQLSVIKELGDKLIDIHSQHQNLLLNDQHFQLHVLDAVAHQHEEVVNYAARYSGWKNAMIKLNKLEEEAERIRADEDYVRFQLNQIDEAHLQADEQEALEHEAEMLSHAEEIKSALYQSSQMLDGDEQSMLQALKDCHAALQGIVKVYPVVAELAERVDSSYIELKDIADELMTQEEQVEFNPQRLEEVNERLNTIYTLQKKHHVDTVSELSQIADDYRHRLDNITSLDDEIAKAEKEADKLYKEAVQMARKLSEKRGEAAKKVEKIMQDLLVPLGMPNVRFKVEKEARQEIDESGIDNVKFLFSANKNGALQDISTVASGGEIARVMLSLKAMLAEEANYATVIFDEIDTGVSGEIAARMAKMMEDMAKTIGDDNGQQRLERQVISITHLPQIAAKGRVHYKVYKKDNENETVSHIRRLTQEERVEEIAHMLSGEKLTEAAMQNAKELLGI